MNVVPFIFNGSSHPLLCQEVAAILGTSLGKRELGVFPDSEIFLEIQEPVKGHPVFVLQSMEDPNFHLVELLILLDALKRAWVESITVVLPYFAYARQDRQDKAGTAITAKLMADLLTTAGANRLIAMDLHSEQIEGFFNIPVHHLLSNKVLIPVCRSLKLEDPVIVAPDKGAIKFAAQYAAEFNAPLATIEKERKTSFDVEMRLFVGNVKGKSVILVDDMCSTGGTLVQAAKACAELGARRIIAVAAHGLFAANAMEKIEKSPIELFITTNSLPCSEKVQKHPKMRIVSIAPLLAEAMGHL